VPCCLTVVDKGIEKTSAPAQVPAPKLLRSSDPCQPVPGTFVTDGMRVDCSRFLAENRQRAIGRQSVIERDRRFS